MTFISLFLCKYLSELSTTVCFNKYISTPVRILKILANKCNICILNIDLNGQFNQQIGMLNIT